MKILVTGGAGFIGSNLCEVLNYNTSNQISVLDNYITGLMENHIKGVEYIKGNTCDIDSLINFTPDIVYHLGEYSRVEQSFNDIELIYRSNIVGTFKVIKFCQKHKCKLIYAGSSTKFGDNGNGRNQSPYGWSKASNVDLVKNFGEWYGLEYAITYFYNVYGKREISDGKYATLIALFTEKFKKGKPLTVVSPGTQIRNFTHVEDIVNGLVMVGEQGQGDGYGIGTSESFTIFEIADMFGGKIEMLPERPGNRMFSDLNVEKTKRLNWKPKHSITDYIKNIVRKYGD
tara:strand:+ start:696 stop:1556 length:861 start_codon:yes stop_codon:yes gene_type:complete